MITIQPYMVVNKRHCFQLLGGHYAKHKFKYIFSWNSSPYCIFSLLSFFLSAERESFSSANHELIVKLRLKAWILRTYFKFYQFIFFLNMIQFICLSLFGRSLLFPSPFWTSFSFVFFPCFSLSLFVFFLGLFLMNILNISVQNDCLFNTIV